MDNGEAIDIIKAKMDVHQAVFGHPVDEPLKTAYETAISALEKQIPKRKLEKDQYNENLFTLRCPTCGALICNYNKRLGRYSYMVAENYCYICGQAIDFSEPYQEEEE